MVGRAVLNLKSSTLPQLPTLSQHSHFPLSNCRFESTPPPTHTHTQNGHPLMLASLSPSWLLPKPTARWSFESNSPDLSGLGFEIVWSSVLKIKRKILYLFDNSALLVFLTSLFYIAVLKDDRDFFSGCVFSDT